MLLSVVLGCAVPVRVSALTWRTQSKPAPSRHPPPCRLQEYATLIEALAHIACPITVDPLWATEFLAVIQCRMADFPPAAMAKLLPAVHALPGIKPGAHWLALAVAW